MRSEYRHLLRPVQIVFVTDETPSPFVSTWKLVLMVGLIAMTGVMCGLGLVSVL